MAAERPTHPAYVVEQAKPAAFAAGFVWLWRSLTQLPAHTGASDGKPRCIVRRRVFYVIGWRLVEKAGTMQAGTTIFFGLATESRHRAGREIGGFNRRNLW
jgi:hypothetical protein